MNDAKRAERVRRFKAGETIVAIAASEGVTYQAVGLTLRKAGLSRHDGGIHFVAQMRCDDRDRARLAKRKAKEERRGMPVGVSKHTIGRTYRAQIGGIHLGTFRTIVEAAAARRAAEIARDEVIG